MTGRTQRGLADSQSRASIKTACHR
jgi:hypothetical protein